MHKGDVKKVIGAFHCEIQVDAKDECAPVPTRCPQTHTWSTTEKFRTCGPKTPRAQVGASRRQGEAQESDGGRLRHGIQLPHSEASLAIACEMPPRTEPTCGLVGVAQADGSEGNADSAFAPTDYKSQQSEIKVSNSPAETHIGSCTSPAPYLNPACAGWVVSGELSALLGCFYAQAKAAAAYEGGHKVKISGGIGSLGSASTSHTVHLVAREPVVASFKCVKKRCAALNAAASSCVCAH